MRRRCFMTHLSQLGVVALLPLRPFGVQSPIGRSLSAPRLDAHNHLISSPLADVLRSAIPDATIRSQMKPRTSGTLIDELDRNGVQRALAFSVAYLYAMDTPEVARRSSDELGDVRQENDFVAAECAKTGGRLIPFGSVNPKREYALAEFGRCVDRLGMRGLKTHFWNSDVRLREPQHVEQVRAVFAAAAERNVPVVVHVFNGNVAAFGAPDIDILVSQIVEPLPSLRISIAHLGGAGGSGPQVQEAFAALRVALRRRPELVRRVWVDCAAVLHTEPAPPPLQATTPVERTRLGELLTAWGVDRVLWGSDTVPDALDHARGAWPLGQDDWASIARNDGTTFLGSGPTVRR